MAPSRIFPATIDESPFSTLRLHEGYMQLHVNVDHKAWFRPSTFHKEVSATPMGASLIPDHGPEAIAHPHLLTTCSESKSKICSKRQSGPTALLRHGPLTLGDITS
jgi:hypothetical protein